MVNFPPKLPESVQRSNFLTKAYILKNIIIYYYITYIYYM